MSELPPDRDGLHGVLPGDLPAVRTAASKIQPRKVKLPNKLNTKQEKNFQHRFAERYIINTYYYTMKLFYVPPIPIII